MTKEKVVYRQEFNGKMYEDESTWKLDEKIKEAKLALKEQKDTRYQSRKEALDILNNLPKIKFYENGKIVSASKNDLRLDYGYVLNDRSDVKNVLKNTLKTRYLSGDYDKSKMVLDTRNIIEYLNLETNFTSSKVKIGEYNYTISEMDLLLEHAKRLKKEIEDWNEAIEKFYPELLEETREATILYIQDKIKSNQKSIKNNLEGIKYYEQSIKDNNKEIKDFEALIFELS